MTPRAGRPNGGPTPRQSSIEILGSELTFGRTEFTLPWKALDPGCHFGRNQAKIAMGGRLLTVKRHARVVEKDA